MKYLSLFTGVGGFDLGADAAGWECVGQCEIDKRCRGVLARHWPRVLRWEDVREVDGGHTPSADVIAFGSPCQDLSIGGRRSGFDGERSGLFMEAIRIIEEMRLVTGHPTWAVWENVPGALTSNRGRDFDVALHALADVGALDIEWAVLDSLFFGVPQRRRRLYVVACFDPRIAERLTGDTLALAARGEEPARPRPSQQCNDPAGAAAGPGNVDEPLAFNWKNGGGYGGANAGLGITVNATGPLSVSQVMAVTTPWGAREITPREAERLQGFPDDHTRWTWGGREVPKTARYRMCGNAITAPVARWVCERIASRS